MKKNYYIFLFSIFLSTAAQSQDSVTLYGIIDMGLQYANVSQREEGPNFNRQFLGLVTGVQSGSRWGMRGNSDISDGYQATFTLENGFNPGNGDAAQGGRLFGRQSTVGIKNNSIGQLDLGRQINLASNYFLPMDPFGEGFGQANIGASFGSTNTVRYSNMLMIQAKPIESLTVGAGYSFSTDLSGIYALNGSCIHGTCQATNEGYLFQPENNLRALTLGAQYSSGPLLLALAYDQLQGPANIPNGPPKPNPTAWLIGGLYDFRTIKLSLVYGQTRNGTWAGQPSGAGIGPNSQLQNTTLGAGALFLTGAATSSFLVGMTVPIGQGSILASLQSMRSSSETLPDWVTGSQLIYSAGYLYSFTRRTNLYAYASYANNYATAQSAQSTVIGVGLRHRF